MLPVQSKLRPEGQDSGTPKSNSTTNTTTSATSLLVLLSSFLVVGVEGLAGRGGLEIPKIHHLAIQPLIRA